MAQMQNDHCDVVVIGGGAAGLAGALVLTRQRRSVVVVDAGQPRNAPASGVHGYLTRDGMSPAELVGAGRLEVQGYGGRILDGRVEQVDRDGDGRLAVTCSDGTTLTARRLLVATGLVDELPDVPGVRERWGRDVLHCPYCHGWEVRDRTIAVLASGPMSVHQALMFRQLSDDVTYLANGLPPAPEQLEQLLARGIRVVDEPVAALQVEQDRLVGVLLADGDTVACQAVVVATVMRARADFLSGIGLAPVEHPSGIVEHLRTDDVGRTGAAGVWAAGNVTQAHAQVSAAEADGAAAGAQINADLAMEDTHLAVRTRRVASSDGGPDGPPALRAGQSAGAR